MSDVTVSLSQRMRGRQQGGPETWWEKGHQRLPGRSLLGLPSGRWLERGRSVVLGGRVQNGGPVGFRRPRATSKPKGHCSEHNGAGEPKKSDRQQQEQFGNLSL